jgi:hypothetical protein
MTKGKHSVIEPALDAPEHAKSSDRSFGLVFATVFLIIGLWPLLDGRVPRIWSLAAACAFGLTAAFMPWVLRPLNAVWMRFGELLHRIVAPVVMGVVFFTVVVPTGLIMRAFGKDPMRLRHEPEARSYWIERQPPGPAPKTMTKQF